MSEQFFYSAKTGGFYPESGKASYEASANGWPDDAIAVSDDDYKALFEGQAKGKTITADSNGKPVLSDPPAQTTAQLIATAETQRDSLLSTAKDKIIVWQTKLAIGRTLTDDEKTKLNAWLDYIDAVEAVDTSKAPDVDWPELPK